MGIPPQNFYATLPPVAFSRGGWGVDMRGARSGVSLLALHFATAIRKRLRTGNPNRGRLLRHGRAFRRLLPPHLVHDQTTDHGRFIRLGHVLGPLASG